MHRWRVCDRRVDKLPQIFRRIGLNRGEPDTILQPTGSRCLMFANR